MTETELHSLLCGEKANRMNQYKTMLERIFEEAPVEP